jgi:hypothetical protein
VRTLTHSCSRIASMPSLRGVLLSVLISTFVVCSGAFGAAKVRDWQDGKVLDSQRSRYFAGTVGNSTSSGNVDLNGDNGTYRGQTSGSQTAVYRVFETFVIEGDHYVYLAQERLRWRWSKAANVTVNGPVKYAFEKRKLFVLDEDGKEHEMEIVKKTLRLPDQPGK